MSKILSDIAFYVKDKISAIECDEYNFISTDNMLVEKRGITKSDYVPKNGFVCGYKKGDVLISNIRPYFKKIWLAEFDGGCSNDILVLRPKENYSSEFLYSLLSQDDFFRYVMQGATGSKMPRGDKNHIMRFKFELPKNYNEIGKFICLLNSKIYNNDKMVKEDFEFLIKTYNYYFQKIDNQETVTLNKYLKINGGYTFDSSNYREGRYYVITIKNVNDIFVDEYNCDMINEIPNDIKEHQKLKIGDLLISLTGKTGRLSFVDKENELLNQRVGIIENLKTYYREYVYCLLNSSYIQSKIQSLSTGGNQKNLSPDDLVNVEIDLFPEEKIEEFSNKTKFILDDLINLGVQNEYYISLKNKLLPFLMNGQVIIDE